MVCAHGYHTRVRRNGLDVHIVMKMDNKKLVLNRNWKKHKEVCNLIFLCIVKILAEKIAIRIYQIYLKNMKMVAERDGNRRQKGNKKE